MDNNNKKYRGAIYGIEIFQDGKLVQYSDELTYKEAVNILEAHAGACRLLKQIDLIHEFTCSIFSDTPNNDNRKR